MTVKQLTPDMARQGLELRAKGATLSQIKQVINYQFKIDSLERDLFYFEATGTVREYQPAAKYQTKSIKPAHIHDRIGFIR